VGETDVVHRAVPAAGAGVGYVLIEGKEADGLQEGSETPQPKGGSRGIPERHTIAVRSKARNYQKCSHCRIIVSLS
jgi:hypothetical protein